MDLVLIRLQIGSSLDDAVGIPLAAFVANLDEDYPGLAGVAADLERKRRLDSLWPWLEARVERGSSDVAVHTTLAKIYVDANIADKFLASNTVSQLSHRCLSRPLTAHDSFTTLSL